MDMLTVIGTITLVASSAIIVRILVSKDLKMELKLPGVKFRIKVHD